MNTKSTLSSYAKTIQGKLRPFFIALLALLFMIPLNMVEGVVSERTYYRDQSIGSIAASWADTQTVTGPILVIPYTVLEKRENFDSNQGKIVITHHKVHYKQVDIPATFKADTALTSEERKRGLYKVPVYSAAVSMQGQFKNVKETMADIAAKGGAVAEPFISIAVKDIRGINGIPAITLNGEMVTPAPGTLLGGLKDGVHVPLAKAQTSADTLDFTIDFALKGMGEFHIMPVGSDVQMSMKSDWPHPSFQGRFLPDQRTVNAEGFSAQWKTGLLATDILSTVTQCVQTENCAELQQKSSGVGLFQPTDIYKQSNRAVKYGFLFVALTFVLFYVMESLRNLSVSLPQFVLVGGALAVFFLLLVSLAEHIGFTGAYLLAATATVVLLTYYVSYVLKGARQGMQTGAALAILYGVLYVILLSEDYALLMGSLLLFLLIASIMVMTRNIDWENLGMKPHRAEKESPEN